MDKSNPDTVTGDPNSDIQTLRNAIDEIDENILDLINRRLLLAAQIGLFKKQRRIQVVDSLREKAILGRLLERNAGPLPKNALQRIFTAIIAAGRDIQDQ